MNTLDPQGVKRLLTHKVYAHNGRSCVGFDGMHLAIPCLTG